MTRRSDGLIGVWAEAQRQHQRREDARRRATEQQQRDQQRAQRTAERDAARTHREQQAAYRQSREADARRRTDELDARVDELTGLLAAGCRAPAFRAGSMTLSEQLEPFSPGALAVPIPMPNQANYQPAQSGWGGNAQQEARARFERDWYTAQAAEAQRVQQLEAYRRQYQQWADARLADIRRHNAGVRDLGATLRGGDPEAVVQYFSAALYASSVWPQDFPRQVAAAYDRGARELVLDWQLPGFDIVPETKSVRYMPSADQDKETARPVTQRRVVYRDVLAQSVLLVVRDMFAADEFGLLDAVVVNGFVDDHDPATGRQAKLVLASATVQRSAYERLNLAQVSAVECLSEALQGQLSAKPDQRASVRAARRPSEVGSSVVSHGDDDAPDLFEMDPIAFEQLVAELFRARGLQALTTVRSGDGGVDVEAHDPDPLSGGRIIVQVKRYRHTVPPTAVRDLYGTVHDVGANKGVLVTTSGFGPGSYTFVRGKPLTLVNGTELVELLQQAGLSGRLGEGGGTRGGSGRGSAPSSGAGVPGQRADAASSPSANAAPAGTLPASAAPAADANVLGMSWSGGVALDVCTLVCEGERVLSDDYFVFFNNNTTPDGTVRTVPASGGDKAAVAVRFDALPARADRVVLVAAIDPDVNPNADLTGFTDACIRLSDARGTVLDELDVSDGRPGETALVLGSFRRRANGDWKFVVGGQGYRGGLEELVTRFGIDVA
ncbi:restriction endonuclease [Yinghuangia seranimata]|uniref:restriction endonuclease n=1 Tax=Yinghuangia seranimata TaxID=408067 RepID=UPI00248B6792|nr:restriction endonuclease [Yinghuangia seranimata]MDI2131531.1 restriction endonuclease [Yinghuangia seranimata]